MIMGVVLALIVCPCGERISDADVPNPHLYHLLSDSRMEEVVMELQASGGDDVALDFIITSHSRSTYECPRCHRLLIFWDGLDRPAASYVRELLRDESKQAGHER